MRLLLCSNTGEFSLTKVFVGDDVIPPYAILSHIWSEEEVTFKDLIDGTGQGKAGYKKIRLCGQQAERDGLQYFWVDTCCIDKSNQVVVQGAVPGLKPAQDAFAQFLGQQPRTCEQDEYDQKAAAAVPVRELQIQAELQFYFNVVNVMQLESVTLLRARIRRVGALRLRLGGVQPLARSLFFLNHASMDALPKKGFPICGTV